MIYVWIYAATGLVAFLGCCIYEWRKYKGDVKDFLCTKQAIKTFIIFLAFWPWVLPFYIMERIR